jgi:hypothetical protein
MDETGGSLLEGIPAHALTLRLARSTIKMRHTETWRVDKSNEVHDLVVCLTGSARYALDDTHVTVEPGSGWIPPRSATVQAKRISTSLPSSDRNASTGDR